MNCTQKITVKPPESSCLLQLGDENKLKHDEQLPIQFYISLLRYYHEPDYWMMRE
jgi:hypothetical protein